MTLPTYRFLSKESGQDRQNPFVERLRRNVLLLLQVLAVVAVALALATPYVAVSESETIRETVLVVDASASMQATSDGTTRFDRARAAASDAATDTTSVVVAASTPRVVLRRGDAGGARSALSGLAPTDAPGDLRSAISTGTAIAGEDARLVVLSDFAGTGWADAVRTARGRGLRVELRQFAGGGDDNVGIVDRSFDGGEVTLAVENFGDAEATRTLSFGDARQSLTLAPGDRETATFEVPAGGAVARLSPGDSMPADDVNYVAAPEDGAVDVLVLTNDRNRFLTAALSVVDEVSLTVKNPPTVVEDSYDVIVYSNLDREALLPGNVEAGRNVIQRGGGVAVQAEESLATDKLGDLVLVAPQGVKSSPTVSAVADTPLTAGIEFSPPERYLAGPLLQGETVVELEDGTPLVATHRRGSGRVLYYGYIESASAFKYNYQYPVFWKRAVFYLADRRPLVELNRETGGSLSFPEPRTVRAPTGEVTADTVRLDAAGVYATDGDRVAASLLDPAESDVRAEPLATADAGEESVPATTEERQVPRRLDWVAALVAVLVVLGEVGYLYRRGDV